MIPSLAAVFILVISRDWCISLVCHKAVSSKPLEPEEEQELLARREQGDEGARNILIERNLRLVAHIVKKFDNTGEEGEDLISIGAIGLIKAINTFDPTKNTRLATYAARCIENESSLSNRQRDSNGFLFSHIVGRTVYKNFA